MCITTRVIIFTWDGIHKMEKTKVLKAHKARNTLKMNRWQFPLTKTLSQGMESLDKTLAKQKDYYKEHGDDELAAIFEKYEDKVKAAFTRINHQKNQVLTLKNDVGHTRYQNTDINVSKTSEIQTNTHTKARKPIVHTSRHTIRKECKHKK